MSRNQDLVVARLRLVARRWQDGDAVLASARKSTADRGTALVGWATEPGAGPFADRNPGPLVGEEPGQCAGVAAPDHGTEHGGEGLSDEFSGAGVVSIGVESFGVESFGVEDPVGAEPEVEGPARRDSVGAGPALADMVGGDAGADPASDGPAWPSAGMWLRLLGLLVLLVAIGAIGLFMSSRPRAQAAAPVIEMAGSAESSDLFGEPVAPEPSQAASILVHVAGEVRKPGVVRLPAGSRVQDAVEAAGGLRRRTELGSTNLARVVSDGERIEVGGSDPASSGDGTPAAAGAPLDLNTATADQLDALPGVGPVTAAKILGWRTEHGRFTVVDELAEVPGIGPKTLAELRPLVRV